MKPTANIRIRVAKSEKMLTAIFIIQIRESNVRNTVAQTLNFGINLTQDRAVLHSGS